MLKIDAVRTEVGGGKIAYGEGRLRVLDDLTRISYLPRSATA